MRRYLVALALLGALVGMWAVCAQAQSQPYTMRPYSVAIDTGTKTATAVAGAATLNKNAGVITTESLSTAAAAIYTLTLTNSAIAATDQVFVSVAFGTATTGVPALTTVAPAPGSVVIKVQNIAASAALNGTLKIAFFTLKN
jgi:hypothetical protein